MGEKKELSFFNAAIDLKRAHHFMHFYDAELFYRLKNVDIIRSGNAI